MSPAWCSGAYATGWQPPLVIAMGLAAVALAASLAYRWIDLRHRGEALTAALDLRTDQKAR